LSTRLVKRCVGAGAASIDLRGGGVPYWRASNTVPVWLAAGVSP
jgi:hypothetical protein